MASSAPNCAGESTTIRVLLGLLRSDSGDVSLLGGDPWRDAVDYVRRWGLTST
jgi:ABC-2 type transport system ATP-binding protein